MKILRANGLTLPLIAERYGCKFRTAEWVCRKTVSKIDNRKRQSIVNIQCARAQNTSRSDARREEARRLRALGLGYRVVAQIMGLCYSTVHGYARDVEIGARRASNKHLAGRSEVPKWVPKWLRSEYQIVARRPGEDGGQEAAASHCRRLKREAELAIAENPSLAASL